MDGKPTDRTPVPPASVIARDMVVDGDIEAEEDLLVEGTVTGGVDSSAAVEVEAGGCVSRGIRAETVRIRGRVSGDVSAVGAVEVEPGGRLCGDCTAGAIRVAEGAVCEGRSRLRDR